MEDNVILNIKLPKELKDTFAMLCKRDGYNASLVVRELIKEYIKKNGQGDLFK